MSHTFFSLEVLPARKGDCLILYHGSGDFPKVSIVDGGPFQVYPRALEPRLRDIRRERGLDDATPLPVELLMVSHIDDDHIRGLLDLADELEENPGQPDLVRVDTIWHNAFDDLIGNEADELAATETALAGFATAGLAGIFDHDQEAVFASVGQGRSLRDFADSFNAAGKGWASNRPHGGLIMMRGEDDPAIEIFDGFAVTVLGPRRAEIEDLQKKWDDFLRDKDLGEISTEAAFRALSQDKSVPNLASIVALLDCDGKTMLLTGDALGSKITEALEERGLASEGNPLHVDILKMQHHGSDRNVTPDFFAKVEADHYVFSGDGSHGNPERRTVEMLLDTLEDREVTLWFSNPVDEIDVKRAEDAARHGEPFTHEAHSLRALLDDRAPAGGVVSVKQPVDRTGLRIDLKDAVPV